MSPDECVAAAKSLDFTLFEAGFLTIPAFPCCFNCLEPRCEAAICEAASAHLGCKPRERAIDCARRYVGAKQGCAQALKKYEMNAPAPCLFVDTHQLLHARGSDPFCRCRVTCALQQRTDAGGVRVRKKPELSRQIGGHDHPGRDGLAVQPRAVSQPGFDGV